LLLVSAPIAALFAAPLTYLLLRSGSDLGAFWSTVSSAAALGPLLRSLLLAATVAAAAAGVGTAAAWIVVRTDVPLSRVWRVLLPLPLVIPSFIGAFVMLAAFAPGGLVEAALNPLGVERIATVDGFAGSFVVLTLFTYPYVYLPVSARLRQLPSSFEESARLLGRRPFATFFEVVLPQARGAILAGSLLVFLYVVSDFGVVELMRYDTLTRAIYSTRLIDRTTSVSLSLLLGIVAIAVVAFERTFTKGLRRPDVRRGARPLVIALGKWKSPALASMALLVGLALAAPVGVLVWWSTRGVFRGSTPASDFIADIGDLLGPLANTSVASIGAAIAAVTVVVPVVYLTVRYRSRVGGIANGVVVGGFALPGLAIALALVYWTIDAPRFISAFYQTLPLLLLAYVVHFGAQAMRTSQVALSSVPRAMEDAARVLGVSRAARFVRVELPLMMPGLLAGAGLVLLSTMKELPATLLLAPIGFQTLAVRIWTATESAFFAEASLASLALILLSGFLTWLLVIRRSEALI
jgi:iron(III) transport system permease protein